MMECREHWLEALPSTVCEYKGADCLPAAPGLSCLQDSYMETSSTALSGPFLSTEPSEGCQVNSPAQTPLIAPHYL